MVWGGVMFGVVFGDIWWYLVIVEWVAAGCGEAP